MEGYKYELIEGKVEVSPLPNLPHACLIDWLVEKLRTYAHDHPEVINKVKAPARVFVPGPTATTAPEPDIAAYRDFPLDRPLDERRWQDVSPALVVEILSEDTANKDLERNRDYYIQVPSIQEYWILDPRDSADQPTLTVYRRRGQRWQKPIEVKAGDTYQPTRLLPDFELVVDPHH
jgi:Uma2 family endonuclease